MSKVHVIVTLMICMSFTGCISVEDLDEDPTLRESFEAWIDAIEAGDWRKYCSYLLLEDEHEVVRFANSTELDDCEENFGNEYDDAKMVVSNYTEKKLDYKVENSTGVVKGGFVYAVNFTVEECVKEDGDEDWDCDDPQEVSINWGSLNGRWGLWYGIHVEEQESAPIATFFVTEDSSGVYHIEVVKVSKQEDLASFSFFLKDENGYTYVGGSNGFGEIAMQMIDGEAHGINEKYSGVNDELYDRRSNVSNDDGSEFPVHFIDYEDNGENGYGKLSAGDKFEVYGQGNGANGPAEEGWRLDIQYDPTGDISASAKLQ